MRNRADTIKTHTHTPPCVSQGHKLDKQTRKCAGERSCRKANNRGLKAKDKYKKEVDKTNQSAPV